MTLLRVKSLRIGGVTIPLDCEIECDLPGADATPSMLSLAEYAKAKGVSERSVRRAITEGRIRAEHFGRRVLIHPDELKPRPRAVRGAR